MLITYNCVLDQAKKSNDTTVDIFSGCSIYLNQFMSEKWFYNISSTLKYTDQPPTPPPPIVFWDNIYDLDDQFMKLTPTKCLHILFYLMLSQISVHMDQKFTCLEFYSFFSKPIQTDNEYNKICSV